MNSVVNVTNRDSGIVGYVIPDTGVNRTFAQGETKKIPVEELKTGIFSLSRYFASNKSLSQNRTKSGFSRFLFSNIPIKQSLFLTTERLYSRGRKAATTAIVPTSNANTTPGLLQPTPRLCRNITVARLSTFWLNAPIW